MTSKGLGEDFLHPQVTIVVPDSVVMNSSYGHQYLPTKDNSTIHRKGPTPDFTVCKI